MVQRCDEWWRNRRQMSPPPTAANAVVLSILTYAGGGGTQVKKFSVKRISNPLMFDPLNNAVPEGLYDPALGPTENHQRCVGSLHARRSARPLRLVGCVHMGLSMACGISGA